MILHKQVAFIIVKIITTVNFSIKSTDEAPISLPTSITRIMLRSLLKTIQIHKKLLNEKNKFDLIYHLLKKFQEIFEHEKVL